MTESDIEVTQTGGRSAATRHIPPKLALAVGMPSTSAPPGWKWSALSSLARLESGHTPSRRHPEYWGGTIPWISIKDAKAHDGHRILDTEEKTNRLGIENSSARLLPENTVCLSRTASVGYVVVMGRPMSTSQDFVNWVCSEKLEPDFLRYLFVSEGENLLRFASGAVHQTIYFPEAKAFHICHPPQAEQRRIVGILHEAFAGIATAKVHAEKNRRNARALFESHLHAVFTNRGSGWVAKPLEQVVEDDCSLSYGIVQPGDDVAGGLPIVRPTDLSQTTINVGGLKRIDPSLASGYERTKLRGGEILLCVRGETGVLGRASNELSGANVTRGIVPIRFKATQISQEVGFYAMSSDVVQTQIRAKTYGAALMQINIRDVRNISIPVPPRSAQREISAQLDALSVETRGLESLCARKLVALDELKAALLHQAFSGQL